MARSYRFGKVYAVLTVASAAFAGWLAYEMLWYGLFWPAVLGAVAVPVAVFTGIGLWRKRRYGFVLLNLSILLGVAMRVYGWFGRSELGLPYRIAEETAFLVVTALIFAYFWKRREEFTARSGAAPDVAAQRTELRG